MKKALVAGGAGFLGSHMCERLLDAGFQVKAIDNFHTGSIDNIKHLMKRNSFSFENFDITTFYDEPCDYILNFACPASPPKYQADPIYTMRVNFEGTLNLLNLAKQNSAVFLQASTSEVYGDPEVNPQPETYKGAVNTNGPRACYDEGKRIAETLCYEFRKRYDVDTKLVRIFNTFGPRMDQNDGRVISNFINQALNGDALTIYGDGSQTRSFIYVSDLIEGMYSMLLKPSEITGPINIGSEFEYSILELATKIHQLIPCQLNQFEFSQLPQDDPLQRRPQLDLAKSLLDWSVQTSFDDGLQKTINYFKSLRGAETENCS